jgi:ADP-ribose pyrophosphatase YjhB (NUDIX family)
MRRLLAPLYRLQRLVWRVVRPRTRGVKVMVFNQAGELLLVRHSYGNTALFMLPGGGIRPLEAPAAAAVREIREELGCGVEELAFVSLHASTQEGKRDSVHLYSARAAGPVRIDGVEIEEARFFALDALPPTVSPATLRRITEYRGARDADGSW